MPGIAILHAIVCPSLVTSSPASSTIKSLGTIRSIGDAELVELGNSMSQVLASIGTIVPLLITECARSAATWIDRRSE